MSTGINICGSCALLTSIALGCTVSTTYALAAESGDDVIGRLEYHTVQSDENLLLIARRHDLGYIEIVAANPGIDPWLPPPGRTVILPKAHILPHAPRTGMVINLPELRLYYFGDGAGTVITHPIGVGRKGRETPIGTTQIVRKREAPTWIPPASIRAERPELPISVPPGPDNPLGAYALDLGWQSYVVHGTNRPFGIGRRVSGGCIRLYPEDIEHLFAIVSVGTPVTVVDQAVKLGWSGGHLFMEVHPDAVEGDQLERTGWLIPAPIPDLERRVRSFAGAAAKRVDWPSVRAVARHKRGIPVQITK
ncbi:MAG: L,D-transpeptidase family protein [Rhodospirillales bacterium]|nr:MAG: L,D-transpeptidase family protein [Rhodospirillales bacterium]